MSKQFSPHKNFSTGNKSNALPTYSGIARNPPPAITEQLKLLNDNLKIGQMLCRSRQPDFLLDIIQRQVKKEYYLMIFSFHDILKAYCQFILLQFKCFKGS